MENNKNKLEYAGESEELVLVLKDLRTAMELISNSMVKQEESVETQIHNAKKMERYRITAIFFGIPCVTLGVYVIVSVVFQAFQ